MPNPIWLLLGAAFCYAHAWLYRDLETAFAGLCLSCAAFHQAWEATHPSPPPADEPEYWPPRDRLGL